MLYSIHVLFQIGGFVLPFLITLHLNLLYIHRQIFQEGNLSLAVLSGITWISINTSYIILLITGFIMTTAEAERTASVIHKIILRVDDQSLKAQVNRFF